MEPMASYGQYCPVAKAVEVLADRWTPLIIRELLAGARRFNEIDRGLPGISRPLLTQRLRRLTRFGVVRHRTSPDGHPEYHLTPAGIQLKEVIDAFGNWGARWILADPSSSELDPALLLWRMRRRINLAQLPQSRFVVEFEFHGAQRQQAWLVLEPDGVSVCLTDPGFDTDVLVTADTAAFHQVWLGRIALTKALREGAVELDGPPALVRAFTRALLYSPFANMVKRSSGLEHLGTPAGVR
ncbi:MAG TPA: winged helix-turn-helix transcriptional regulator [bacterium]|nr:winged helix-turn-helix transcriptional regulator [bacterium]